MKIDYYQVYLDLWTSEKAAADLAVTNDVPGLLTAKDNAVADETTKFANRNTIMIDSDIVGLTAYTSYATYKAAYDVNPMTTTGYNA